MAGGLGVGLVAAAEVVSAGVHDDPPSDNAALAVETEDLVGKVDLGDAVGVRLNVAEVADVAVAVARRAVLTLVRVEVAAGREAVVARRNVAKLVDVEAVLGVGGQAADLERGLARTCGS